MLIQQWLLQSFAPYATWKLARSSCETREKVLSIKVPRLVLWLHCYTTQHPREGVNESGQNSVHGWIAAC